MKRSAVMFIAIGGPKAHVTLSMTDTLFQQPARPSHSPPPLSCPSVLSYLCLETGNEAAKQPAAPGVIKPLPDHRLGLVDGLLDSVIF